MIDIQLLRTDIDAVAARLAQRKFQLDVAAFNALEIYKGGEWQPLGDPAAHRAELHPLSVDPIAEQVARIALPEVRLTRD